MNILAKPSSILAVERVQQVYMSSDDSETESSDGRIDLSLDDRLYRIRLPRAPGIEWGTDLSFSFVYVRDMDPAGPASFSDVVSKGDQL